jgi:hypothetical protein
MAVTREQRRLLIVSDVSVDVKKWKWLYRWLDDNCIRLGKQMARRRYRSVSTLKAGEVSREALVTRMRYLSKTVGTQALDVFLNMHGRRDALKFVDGWIKVESVAEELAELNLGHRFRLLYSMACYGADHAPLWVEAGFKTASGAVGVNANGTYDYPVQIAKWRDGRTYESAVRAGNNGFMRTIHDEAAELAGFDDVDSEKVIVGVKSLTITSPAD